MSNRAGSGNRAHDGVPVVGEATAAQLQRELDSCRRLSEVDKRAAVAMLAANLAHKVGTPLNVIRGRAEHVLRREQNPPKTIQGLETIINQVDKISETIKILLELGRQDATREPHDVRELVSSSADLMQTVADRRQVTFNLELGDTPLVVRCDPDQLQQVFVHLMSNAIDAAEEEGGALRIVARPGDDPESRVRLAFETRGSAVAPAVPARLVDLFFTTK